MPDSDESLLVVGWALSAPSMELAGLDVLGRECKPEPREAMENGSPEKD